VHERKLQVYLKPLEQTIYEIDWTTFLFCFRQYIINAATIMTLVRVTFAFTTFTQPIW